MKKHIGNFIMRGVVGGFFGPIVLAVIYGILGHSGVIVTMTSDCPNENVIVQIQSPQASSCGSVSPRGPSSGRRPCTP